jgi:hypothetical protein
LGQILGGDGEVGVQDHQQVARGAREALTDGVPLAATGLPAGDDLERTSVGGHLALDRLPGVVGVPPSTKMSSVRSPIFGTRRRMSATFRLVAAAPPP